MDQSCCVLDCDLWCVYNRNQLFVVGYYHFLNYCLQYTVSEFLKIHFREGIFNVLLLHYCDYNYSSHFVSRPTSLGRILFICLIPFIIFWRTFSQLFNQWTANGNKSGGLIVTLAQMRFLHSAYYAQDTQEVSSVTTIRHVTSSFTPPLQQYSVDNISHLNS